MPDHLVDTNLLLRSADPSSVQHSVATKALARLRLSGNQLVVAPQALVEFWAVATRPLEANGFGWDAARTAEECREFLKHFPLLEDRPPVFTEWMNLVERHGVRGRRAFDARLVAVMQVHGITHIVTFNTDDFRGFTGILIVDPHTIT